ncbi:hypothetical protein ACEQ8H_002801 [Pleosporales sp. CAS-2024a]
MPYTIAAFVTRLPTLSPTAFRTAYESHIPFLLATVGAAASPSTVTRQYVRRAKADPAGLTPVSFTDSPHAFDYDVLVQMTFRDEQHAAVFQQAYGEKKREIGESMGEFAELSRVQVIAFEDAICD